MQRASKTATDICNSCAPHQRAILGMLALSDRHQLPLSDLLADLKLEIPRRFRDSIDQVNDEIAEGITPIESIARQRGLLPVPAIAAINLAQESNQLGLLYDRVLERTEEVSEVIPSERQKILWSLLRNGFIYLIIFTVFTFVCVKIIPELKDMSEEFGMETVVIFDWFGVMAKFWFIPFLIFMLITTLLSPAIYRFVMEALLGWNPHFWQTRSMSSAAEKRKLLSRITAMGDNLSSNMENMLGLSSNSDGNDESSQRLAIATDKVVSRAESLAVSSTTSNETESWLLDFFSRRFESNLDAHSILIIKILIIIANVIMGLFAILIICSIFLTLLSIIEGLNQW